MGDIDDAIMCFKNARTLTSDLGIKSRSYLLEDDAYKLLGIDYIDKKINNLENAVKELSVYGNLVHTELLADAYSQKASTLYSNEKFEYYKKALNCYEEISSRGLDTPITKNNMAIIYQYIGNYYEAEKILNDIIKEYPKDYKGYIKLAFLEIDKQATYKNENRDYSKAINYYNLARKYLDVPDDVEMIRLSRLIEDIKSKGWV